ncbi:formylglycine-generating enzyme family protein [Methanolobus zinderi]|uniref:Formylglycine-generating enzyme family protein n=1 Tax=Methanolobus zinderi TaxID=536044 RepID=A0A7D5I0F1_9EURY|nr:formylglycine-generating enzyme family protein [Methanolobus zinderi]QLC49766.1 formylglycine-generating enzyme family protein [Methanolobus zinderi]
MIIYSNKIPVRECSIILIIISALLLPGCIESSSGELETTYNNSLGMEFVLIPEGEFSMGSDSTPIVAFDDPYHAVSISESFYMGIYEVTQEEWTTVMGENPSFFKDDNRPVEQVSWNDAQQFIDKLNEMEGTTKYRLPTEAEWEYAARAGSTGKFSFTEDADDLDNYGWSDTCGWCALNSNATTHPVGEKQANQWGLYDMHGNVWEWTQDSWHDNYEGAPADGSAWEDTNTNIKVGRGGSWMDGPNICQCSFRGQLDADSSLNVLGFRLVKDI